MSDCEGCHAIFMQAIRLAPLGLVLVVLESEEVETSAPDKVQSMLTEF